MSRQFILALPVLASLAVVTGCGSGLEPLNLLGDAESIPALELPLSADNFSATIASTRITPYHAVIDATTGTKAEGFIFSQGTYFTVGTQRNVLAPADGVVANISTLQEGALALQELTIVHSSRLTTQLTRLTTTKRVGDPVYKGEVVGTVTSSATVAAPYSSIAGVITLMAVRLDGQLICPLSFLSQTAQQTINTSFGTFFTGYTSLNPCQP